MSADSNSNNKRIAKNTLYLYLRMFVMMAVSLFTSRVVLDVLGAEDYGINNVINGVIVMFSFLNTALLSATQRFLNFNLGKKDFSQTNVVFCMSMNIYIMLSIIVIIVGETLGLWFFNTLLNIPSDRFAAAQWVYQFTIIQFVINLIRVPYNASIIAYERMDFYAYISLFEVILKLLVVYLLVISPFDKLIFYSFLYTIVPLLVLFIYRWYNIKKFSTSNYSFIWDKKTFKELFSFSGWTLFGAFANVLATQGLNIMINIFHGVAVNAAAGVATQVSNSINGFITNFQTAFQPQIVKTYASGELDQFFELLYRTSKFSYYLIAVLAIPIIFSLDWILGIWLVEVPVFTSEFCRLILVFMMLDAFSAPLWMSVQAVGKIREYQIIMTLIAFVNFPVGYATLKMGYPPYCIWIVRIVVNVLMIVTRCIYTNKKFEFPIFTYLKKVVIPIVKVTIISLIVPLFIYFYLDEGSIRSLTSSLVSFVLLFICIYSIGLSISEKKALVELIKTKIKK